MQIGWSRNIPRSGLRWNATRITDRPRCRSILLKKKYNADAQANHYTSDVPVFLLGQMRGVAKRDTRQIVTQKETMQLLMQGGAKNTTLCTFCRFFTHKLHILPLRATCGRLRPRHRPRGGRRSRDGRARRSATLCTPLPAARRPARRRTPPAATTGVFCLAPFSSVTRSMTSSQTNPSRADMFFFFLQRSGCVNAGVARGTATTARRQSEG